ncbi:ABC transporter substrate-binding protein [Hydrogenophaga defluvii]|uniref:ABC transporter substrate-binding protein n=1 Tax=Hydrogenophaga defluvii TaxID=249410 RepID=A0ABW2S930_9BURK
MKKTKLGLWCVLGVWLTLMAGPLWAQRVVFINPGKKDEAYWAAAAQSMQAAARSLGQSLEVFYAEREHLRALTFARELVARAPSERPDYAVFSNDYGTGAELLRIFEGSGIRCFLAFSKPPPDGPSGAGRPREHFKHWVGSLEPRAEDAGYLTARALIEKGRAARAQAPDGKLHLLAIAGDRSTTASVLRNEGMRRAVREAGDVLLVQEVYADWSREKATEQATWLWQRHPHAKLVWAGNDLMAFGAMAAWEQRGGTPGKTAWFSGINTSSEAMAALKSGRLAALAGGHFITGAWALVMIHDHHHGHDFADEGLALERSMFTLFNERTADVFLARFGPSAEPVDYRRYSKVLNPQVRRYEFGFAQLLR